MAVDLLAQGQQILSLGVGSGRTQAECRCDIFVLRGGERTLCSAAQGTVRKAG